MRVHVALLRGINVGGKNLLPMKELAAIFTAAGCSNVKTYIQSGNVVFTAPQKVLKDLPARIGADIKARFGHQPPVIVRSREELEDAILNNPFLRAGKPEETLHLFFLADHPSPDRLARLEPDRSPPDLFTPRGRDIYLHLPNGAGNTKLTNAWIDSRLATVSTLRNWRTVLKLLEMMRESV
jgi:uncharacterized protein (DUF1697 family)